MNDFKIQIDEDPRLWSVQCVDFSEGRLTLTDCPHFSEGMREALKNAVSITYLGEDDEDMELIADETVCMQVGNFRGSFGFNTQEGYQDVTFCTHTATARFGKPEDASAYFSMFAEAGYTWRETR